jgi:hypothetical protein
MVRCGAPWYGEVRFGMAGTDGSGNWAVFILPPGYVKDNIAFSNGSHVGQEPRENVPRETELNA